MTILMISICLMALIRYGMSHRRKKLKDQEIEDDRIISSAGLSLFHYCISCQSRTFPFLTFSKLLFIVLLFFERDYRQIDICKNNTESIFLASVYHASVYGPGYAPSAVGLDLDLPAAHTLDDRPNYFM